MKKNILFLFLFVLTINGFSQNIIKIDDGEKRQMDIPLANASMVAYSKIPPLHVTFKWDGKAQLLHVQFEGDGHQPKYRVWFINQDEPIKSFSRKNPGIKFHNQIKYDKQLKKFWSSTDVELLNITEDMNLELSSEAKHEFIFKRINAKSDTANITFNLYFAVMKKKFLFFGTKIKFEYLKRIMIPVHLGSVKDVCDDDKAFRLIHEINEHTQLLKEIAYDLDSLSVRQQSEKFDEVKKEASTFPVRKINSFPEYQECELLQNVIRENKSVYEEIQAKTFVKSIKHEPVVSVESCTHSLSNTLSNANQQLFELTKKIHQAKKAGNDLDTYIRTYQQIKRDVDMDSCSKCIAKNRKNYNTYKAWCKTIDDLLN